MQPSLHTNCFYISVIKILTWKPNINMSWAIYKYKNINLTISRTWPGLDSNVQLNRQGISTSTTWHWTSPYLKDRHQYQPHIALVFTMTLNFNKLMPHIIRAYIVYKLGLNMNLPWHACHLILLSQLTLDCFSRWRSSTHIPASSTCELPESRIAWSHASWAQGRGHWQI